MKTQTIMRHGVELSIPDGCEIIDLDYTFWLPMASVIIYYYPQQKKIVIVCGCRGAYTMYDPKRYGTDGYTYFIHNF